MAEFTPVQGQYLAFIYAYTNLHGYPPAETEIATALGVAPPSVHNMIKMMDRKGLISREPGIPRSIQIVIPENEIPVWKAPRQKPPR